MIYNIYTNTKLQIILILIVIILLILIFNIYNTNIIDTFNTIDTVNNIQPKENTRLYGSVFLDNLYEQIITLTNPPIEYYKKRIELNNYNDIIL